MNKLKFPRFPSFQFYAIPKIDPSGRSGTKTDKIENSETSEVFLLSNYESSCDSNIKTSKTNELIQKLKGHDMV